MSNRVAIQICEFHDHSLNGTLIDTHYGYRIYDDYSQSYNNTFDGMQEVCDFLDPASILGWVEVNHPEFYESVLFKNGLYLCNDWIDVWEQMDDDQHECYNPKNRFLGSVY
jgi:hypothetical protein